MHFLFKPKRLFLLALFCSFCVLACKKEDEDLKRRVAELESRVISMENRLDQMDTDLLVLEKLGKLNANETTALKTLTSDLLSLTAELKAKSDAQVSDIVGVSEQIINLRKSVENAITTIQFDALNKTVTQLNTLLNQHGMDQKITAENIEKLDVLIEAMSSDLAFLKKGSSGATLDRPINLAASQGSFGDQIVVSWAPMPTAKNYQLFKFNDIKGDYEMVYEGGDTLFNDIASFEPYRKVFYKVKVFNSSSSYSDYSDVAIGYTLGSKYYKHLSFGYEGTVPGSLGFILFLSLDKENNLYLSDDYRGWIQKFDYNGNFREIFFTLNRPAASTFLSDGIMVLVNSQSTSNIRFISKSKQVIKEWGDTGTGDSQIMSPQDIALDEEENIYIVDAYTNTVKKFGQDGKLLFIYRNVAVRTPEQVEGPAPRGLCYLNGKIFVSSFRNGLIRVFDKSGKFLYSWDTGAKECANIIAQGNNLYISCVDFIMKTDELGQVRERIGVNDLVGSYLTGMVVNTNGDIIVSAPYDRRIHIFREAD